MKTRPFDSQGRVYAVGFEVVFILFSVFGELSIFFRVLYYFVCLFLVRKLKQRHRAVKVMVIQWNLLFLNIPYFDEL